MRPGWSAAAGRPTGTRYLTPRDAGVEQRVADGAGTGDGTLGVPVAPGPSDEEGRVLLGAELRERLTSRAQIVCVESFGERVVHLCEEAPAVGSAVGRCGETSGADRRA